jgi:hypothetical protein
MNYLDPGSGSLIIQMVIAAVLGVGVFIRVFWKNIKGFFTGKKVSEDSVEDPTAIIVKDHTAIVDADSTTLAPDDPAATMDDDPTAFSPDSI